MRTMNIPDRGEVQTKLVDLDCGTKIPDEDAPGGFRKETTEFQAEFPASLADAIGLEGEDAIWARVANSIAIEKQGEKRRELQAQYDDSKGRKKAKYLEALGL